MKAASVSEIKQELKDLEKKELVDICLRLARFKKDNKELITFLLFEESDIQNYIKNVKEEIDCGFLDVNQSNVYFAKKTLRKVLRQTNKYIKYAGNKTVEAELLLHYCTNFKGLRLPWQKSPVLKNIYLNQLKKIKAALDTLHEDLQYEYRTDFQRLEL